MVQPDVLILFQIWHLELKYQKIQTSINTYFNEIKHYLVSEVRKLGSSALCKIFVNLTKLKTKRLDLIILLPLIIVMFTTKVILTIKMRKIAILLNFQIKHEFKLVKPINTQKTYTNFGFGQVLIVLIFFLLYRVFGQK